MTRITSRRAACLLGGVAVSALAVGHAEAQQQEASPQDQMVTLDEIIVTALRREQSVQEAPAAISVLTQEHLREIAAQDIRDYVTTVPGMTYAEDNVGRMRVTIRGVADGISGDLTGIYIDETPVTGTGLDPDIYDVAMVEVLKGPQGTLYGAGSMGGTARIITNKPLLDAFEGSVAGQVTTKSDGDMGGRLDGVVNLPIASDRLALRVSAGYRDEGGWVDNVVTGEKDTNTLEKKNVRAQLLYAPGQDTSIILGAMYQTEDLGAPSRESTELDRYQAQERFRQTSESEASLLSLTVSQDFDGASLVSATNYLRRDSNSAFAINFSPALVGILTGVMPGPDDSFGLDAPIDTTRFTQEVRLASTGVNRLDWLVGAFYEDISTSVGERFNLTQAPSLDGVVTGEGFYDARTDSSTRQIAAFGELTFNFTEKLSATAGLRFFDVRNDNTLLASGLLNDGDSSEITAAKSRASTTKFAVRYQVSRNHLLYAQAAEGYRNGGANSTLPASCDAALALAGYSSAPMQYGPDSLWSYEIGSKNMFFGGRAQLNAALFYIDWSNMQSTIGLAECGMTFTANSGSAVSKGLEVDGSFWLTNAWSMGFSVSKLDAELAGVGVGAPGQVGDSLPFAPEWSWNANTRYEWGMGDGLMAFVRADVNYVGSRYTDFQSVARAELLDDYMTLGARIGLQGDRWELSVFGTNLSDEHIVLNMPGNTYRQVARPRTIGVSFRSTF